MAIDEAGGSSDLFHPVLEGTGDAFACGFTFTPFTRGLLRARRSARRSCNRLAGTLALLKGGRLRLSAPARGMARQFGEVYHLSLIAVGPRNGTEQFSAFISAALEKNLGAVF